MTSRDKKKLNIYFDNCCFNRPYDNQAQLRIELETKAKLFIQNLVVDGKVKLTISSVSRLENNDNPFPFRRMAITDFFRNADFIVTSTDEIRTMASNLVNDGLKSKDSAHIACAISAECDYFITTDDKLLKRNIDHINIIDPTEFLRIWEDRENDE